MDIIKEASNTIDEIEDITTSVIDKAECIFNF